MDTPFTRPLALARSVTTVAALATLLTGSGLLVLYRPADSTLSTVLLYTHLVSIAVAAQAIIAQGVLGLIGSLSPSDTARRVLGLGVALIAFIVSVLTGVLLGWDQLALKAVSAGADLRGYRWLLGDEVDFAIVDDTVVGVDTLQRLLIVHLGSAFVVVAAGIIVPRLLSKPSDQR